MGFSGTRVLLLVLSESLVLAATGGAAGVVAARSACGSLSGIFPGMVLRLPPAALLAGLGLAMVVGLLGAALPARAAMRLPVANALGRV